MALPWLSKTAFAPILLTLSVTGPVFVLVATNENAIPLMYCGIDLLFRLGVSVIASAVPPTVVGTVACPRVVQSQSCCCWFNCNAVIVPVLGSAMTALASGG